MSFQYSELIQTAGEALDLVGVVVIFGGIVASTISILVTMVRHKNLHHIYKTYRQNLARSILIGLEFLVAGDIIRSVAGNLNFDSVIILAIIVIIRSFLGMEFEMEIEGHWPWQRSRAKRKNSPEA